MSTNLELSMDSLDGWFPQEDEYTPGLTLDDWRALLSNAKVFTDPAVELVRHIVAFGGAATCKELAEEFGGTPSRYIGIATGLARRVVKATGCPLTPDGDDWVNARWWPIPFIGAWVDRYYAWRLRPELAGALAALDGH